MEWAIDNLSKRLPRSVLPLFWRQVMSRKRKGLPFWPINKRMESTIDNHWPNRVNQRPRSSSKFTLPPTCRAKFRWSNLPTASQPSRAKTRRRAGLSSKTAPHRRIKFHLGLISRMHPGPTARRDQREQLTGAPVVTPIWAHTNPQTLAKTPVPSREPLEDLSEIKCF